jgi:hypothetical protein
MIDQSSPTWSVLGQGISDDQTPSTLPHAVWAGMDNGFFVCVCERADHSSHQPLTVERVSETFDTNTALTWLITQEDFIMYCHYEKLLKSYILEEPTISISRVEVTFALKTEEQFSRKLGNHIPGYNVL